MKFAFSILILSCGIALGQPFLERYENLYVMLQAGRDAAIKGAVMTEGLNSRYDGGGSIWLWRDGDTSATNSDLTIVSSPVYTTGRWRKLDSRPQQQLINNQVPQGGTIVRILSTNLTYGTNLLYTVPNGYRLFLNINALVQRNVSPIATTNRLFFSDLTNLWPISSGTTLSAGSTNSMTGFSGASILMLRSGEKLYLDVGAASGLCAAMGYLPLIPNDYPVYDARSLISTASNTVYVVPQGKYLSFANGPWYSAIGMTVQSHSVTNSLFASYRVTQSGSATPIPYSGIQLQSGGQSGSGLTSQSHRFISGDTISVQSDSDEPSQMVIFGPFFLNDL